MKLYLSSFRLGNDPQKLVDLLGTNKKIAVIANAIDDPNDKERKQRVENEILSLQNIGIRAEELDLRNYFGRGYELKKKLQEYGGVWVRGGNTFVLRRAMQESEFDKLLKEKTTDKDFVYAGYSAGICVLAPNLKGTELVDDPDYTPPGYKEEIIWEGLDLLDYHIAPHYRSEHPESPAVENEVEYYQQHNIPYKTLRDGEVIIETIYPPSLEFTYDFN